MSKLFNRAKMTTATTGTGNLTLGSAASGFVTFATAGVVNGDVVRYCIEAENGTDFEIGEGTYTASGTVLSRADADVQLSSNSNNRITLASGTHNVFITATDSDFTQEIIVTVVNAGAGNKYVIDGTSQQIITLLPSITYRLDQSDSTNATHPLVLASGSADGSTYSTGVRVVGTPGSKGSYTEVKLEQDAPALFYKCSNHAGMGNSINLAAPASGGVTSYSNLAGFPSSNNTHGDMAYAQDTKVSYMWLDTSWQRMSIGPQIGPRITTEPPAAHSLQNDGSTSTITIAAVDESGFPITYDWDAVQGSTLYNAASLPTALTSVAESNGVFTLTPSTNSSHATSTLKFRAKASDGVLFTPAITTVSLSFINYMAATGGSITTVGNYKIHVFNASGNFSISSAGIGQSEAGIVQYLIVAGGGGGGGGQRGAGAGAGGLLTGSSTGVAAGAFSVVVGAGGAGGIYNTNPATINIGTQGGNSSFNSLTAIGGGYGAAADSNLAGGNGGSGGGGWYSSSVGGNGTSGQGNNGGSGGTSPPYGGAGGGAGSVGSAFGAGQAGGVGLQNSITGTAVYYAGGGSASNYNANSNVAGGLGGGGIGHNASGTHASANGTANTGGGGGSGGSGGSGIVILKYRFQA